MDDQAAVFGDLGIVAMGPDAGEAGEVGRVEFLACRIVPEAHWHRREVAGADQLAFFAGHRTAFIAPYLHVHAQALALQLAAPYRQHRVAEGEAGDDVGATGDGGQAEVRLDVAVDVLEALVGQRRAGRENGLQAAQVVCFARPGAGLFQGGDELGTGAEEADVLGVDQVDQALGPRVEGRAVEQHQAGAQRQP